MTFALATPWVSSLHQCELEFHLELIIFRADWGVEHLSIWFDDNNNDDDDDDDVGDCGGVDDDAST